eukprot:132748_1
MPKLKGEQVQSCGFFLQSPGISTHQSPLHTVFAAIFSPKYMPKLKGEQVQSCGFFLQSPGISTHQSPLHTVFAAIFSLQNVCLNSKVNTSNPVDSVCAICVITC